MARPLEARADTKMRKKRGQCVSWQCVCLGEATLSMAHVRALVRAKITHKENKTMTLLFFFFFLSSVCMALAASMKKRVRAKKGGLKDPPNRAAAEKARPKKGGLGQCCDTGAKRKHCAHQKERTAAVVGSTAKRDSTTGDSTVPTSTISPAMGTK